ncbi:hypothetical protein ALC57_14863 [Trachymyrmex cornetzi]|uniref:Uncharacterized protein n=1 Tax=Trachymyrmex cornetzi TaxID=471704 RepID=A0A151IXP3_9HYME|nr:hypothetical protein ALC57_14863 [Trachymyrmex cornetzi]
MERYKKAYILKKESKRRSHIEGTGGGPPSKIIFSNFEEEVLELLMPESAGLLNIPEGGINIEATTSLQNDPENYINIEESVLNDCERNTEDTVTIEPQIERLHTEIYNVENGSSNILKQQKGKYIINKERNETIQNKNITKGNNKENSMSELSHQMLKIQQKKYKLKKKQVKLLKIGLKMQHDMLSELKDIKTSIQSWETSETL